MSWKPKQIAELFAEVCESRRWKVLQQICQCWPESLSSLEPSVRGSLGILNDRLSKVCLIQWHGSSHSQQTMFAEEDQRHCRNICGSRYFGTCSQRWLGPNGNHECSAAQKELYLMYWHLPPIAMAISTSSVIGIGSTGLFVPQNKLVKFAYALFT